MAKQTILRQLGRLGLAGLILALGGCGNVMFWMAGCRQPTNVVVSVDAPLTVARGEEFTLTMTVRNTAERPQKLVSIDVGSEYLEGIAITRTEPDHREVFHVPIDNSESYVFDRILNPDHTVTILFFARSLKAGDYSADVDFCINSEISFLTKRIRTVVE